MITVTAFQQQTHERKVFVGDCLFAGSIGRTDLPGGCYEELMDSLSNKRTRSSRSATTLLKK
jgi:glyoxylase-like metal-dependent hydrolase (beta-lactamase superfamily II)